MSKLDELKNVHQKVMDFTFNCDNKASFLGAIIGIMITAIVASNPFWEEVQWLLKSAQLFWSKDAGIVFDWYAFFIGLCLIISVITLIVALILILKVLLPRLGRPQGDSSIYFGHIGNIPIGEYENKMLNLNENSLLKDYIEQVHVCSVICKKKFNHYRCAVQLTICSIISFVLFITIVIISKL